MTDIAPKTPNKRKSFDGEQGSAKKAKVGNGPTPQQFGTAEKQETPKSQNNQTPKQNNQQTPNPQKNQSPKQNNQQTPKQNNQQTPKQFSNNQGNEVSKSNKNNKKGDKPNVTPFKGTSLIKIDTPVSGKTGKDKIKSMSKVTPLKKKKTKTDASKKKDGQKIKNKKKPPYHALKGKIMSEDNTVKRAAIADLENKIKEMESRGPLTKEAERKFKLLRKYKRIAEGVHHPDPPAKNPHPKSKKEKTGTDALNNKDGKRIKKRKNNQFHAFKDKIKSEDTTVRSIAILDLENKIKEIESRGELTKTANRKLKLLRKYKRIAERVHHPDPPAKNPHPKSKSKIRRDKKNKAIKNKLAVKKENGKVVKEGKDDSEEGVNYAERVLHPDLPSKNPHPKSESTKRTDKRNKAEIDKPAVKPVAQIKKEVKEEEDSDDFEEVNYAEGVHPAPPAEDNKPTVKPVAQIKKEIKKEVKEEEDSDDSEEVNYAAFLQQKKGVVKEEPESPESEDSDDSNDDDDGACLIGEALNVDSDDSEDEDESGEDEEVSGEEDDDDSEEDSD